MLQRLKNFLIGEPLTHDNSSDDHLLSKVQALAMLSSDLYHLSHTALSKSHWS